jgi:hypothetical protein
VLVEPANFVGPTAVAVGSGADAAQLAASLILRHGRVAETPPLVDITRGPQTSRVEVHHDPSTDSLTPIGATTP